MNNNSKMKNGDVYIAFVRFQEFNDPNKGKSRPVVIFEDPEEERLFACKVSSKVDKPKNRKYGYVIKDWEEAGFKKPSVVACNRKDIHEISETNIKKYIGRLTERDIKGMLIKHIKVAQLEYKKEMEKNEIER